MSLAAAAAAAPSYGSATSDVASNGRPRPLSAFAAAAAAAAASRSRRPKPKVIRPPPAAKKLNTQKLSAIQAFLGLKAHAAGGQQGERAGLLPSSIDDVDDDVDDDCDDPLEVVVNGSKRSGPTRPRKNQCELAYSTGTIWSTVRIASIPELDHLIETEGEHVLWKRDALYATPLHLCFVYNSPAHYAMAVRIMDAYPELVCDQYYGTEYAGENILHIAIVNQQEDVVCDLLARDKGLLTQRAVGNFFQRGQPCYYGELPLFFAACTRQMRLVKLLLDAGADMNEEDGNGNSLLHMCVIHELTDMYTFLKAEWLTRFGSMPVISRPPELWKRTNLERHTPLTLAAKLGSERMFAFLLEEDRRVQWSYGPVSCVLIPLEGVDLPLNTDGTAPSVVYSTVAPEEKDAPPTGPRLERTSENAFAMPAARIDMAKERTVNGLHPEDSPEENALQPPQTALSPQQQIPATSSTSPSVSLTLSPDGRTRPSPRPSTILPFEHSHRCPSVLGRGDGALELIVKHAHLNLLMHPRVLELIEKKWDKFARRIFWRRFVTSFIYLAIFAVGTIWRTTVHQKGTHLLTRATDATGGDDTGGHHSHHGGDGGDLAASIGYNPIGMFENVDAFLFDLFSSSHLSWSDVFSAHATFQYLGELIVVVGAGVKGFWEIHEMRKYGLASYRNATGSALLENVLSLTFCICIFLVLILTALNSPMERAVMAIASITAWCYCFFFLLAFRLTGPMVNRTLTRSETCACVRVMTYAYVFPFCLSFCLSPGCDDLSHVDG